MKPLSLFPLIAVIIAIVGMNSAIAGKQNTPVVIKGPLPLPVTIQNGNANGSIQPFCPCFTTEEIEAELAGPPVECLDDRILSESNGSLTRMDSENALVSVSGKVDASLNYSYGCSLGRIVGGDVDFVVSFPDIGFTNMMACRLTIINSPSWQVCPDLTP